MIDTIHVYTDGACSNNPGPAGIGVLLKYKNNKKEISKYLGESTNNIAEMTAIYEGLLCIKEEYINHNIKVYTDSAYCIGLLSQNWKAKANRELVQKTRKLTKKFSNLEFVKVKGHSNHVENNIVDKLAVDAYKKKVTK